MPIHDWTRVRPGTFHHFHHGWITQLSDALNGGLLPRPYYAMAEQPATDTIPDVLALEAAADSNGQGDWPFTAGGSGGGMLAVAEAPPKVSYSRVAEAAICAARASTLTIRHASGDRIVALIEVVSPGNKSKRDAFRAFVDKAVTALNHGYHLLILDLFAPGTFDPNGIHGAIWSEIEDAAYESPLDLPLTLAAYEAGGMPACYVEPTAVGRELIDMPVFLTRGHFINVPLESTYMSAWRGVPQRWREVIERG